MIWGEMSYNRLFGGSKKQKEESDDYIYVEEIESDEFMLMEDEKE